MRLRTSIGSGSITTGGNTSTGTGLFSSASNLKEVSWRYSAKDLMIWSIYNESNSVHTFLLRISKSLGRWHNKFFPPEFKIQIVQTFWASNFLSASPSKTFCFSWVISASSTEVLETVCVLGVVTGLLLLNVIVLGDCIGEPGGRGLGGFVPLGDANDVITTHHDITITWDGCHDLWG